MVASLLDSDSYGMTIDEIADLTVRQITFLYYRDRDKEGKPKILPYYFIEKEEKLAAQYAHFVAMGKQLGKSDEEIEEIWRKAQEING